MNQFLPSLLHIRNPFARFQQRFHHLRRANLRLSIIFTAQSNRIARRRTHQPLQQKPVQLVIQQVRMRQIIIHEEESVRAERAELLR